MSSIGDIYVMGMFWYFVTIQLYFFCRGSYFTNGCRNSRQLSGQKTTSSLLVSSLKYTMQKNFEFFIAYFIIEWHEIPIELIKFYVFLPWVVKYLCIDFGKGWYNENILLIFICILQQYFHVCFCFTVLLLPQIFYWWMKLCEQEWPHWKDSIEPHHLCRH